MTLSSTAAALLLCSLGLLSCEKQTSTKNHVSEPLTAQELANIIQVQSWKIKIHEIPSDAEWLQMVVLDAEGKIIQEGNSLGLAGLRDAKKPLELLIGIQWKDGDAEVLLDGNGVGSRFKLADPLNQKAPSAAGAGRSMTKASGSDWDGKFLYLLSDSKTLGAGPKPFLHATRIIALHYRSEKDPTKL